jgi:hypothetical protein
MYHLMRRGDWREKIFLDDIDRQDFIKPLAEACQKTGWQVPACGLMPTRRKNDPDKLEIAARLRRETTLSVMEIAARVDLVTSKAANVKRHWHLGRSPAAGSGQMQFC